MSENQETTSTDSGEKQVKKSIAGKERLILWVLVVGLLALAVWQYLRIVRLENAVVEMLNRPNPAATASNVNAVKEKLHALKQDAASKVPAGKKRPKGVGGAAGMPSSPTKDLPTGETRLEGKKLEMEMAKTLQCDNATALEILEILSRETKRRRALQVELEKKHIPEEHFISEVKALRAETDRQAVSRLDEEQTKRYMKMRTL